MPPLILTSLGLYSGAALCSAVVARGAWSLWEGWRRKELRQKTTTIETKQFLRLVDAVRLRSRASNPARAAWQGTRTLKVIAVADEARDCRSFYLADPAGQPLPPYQPGQYLTFELPQLHTDRPLVRCYSLSDRPRPDCYRITIKRAWPPQRLTTIPPGLGSSYFFEHLKPGATVEVKAPGGQFFLDPADRSPVVLIGGGIGITPVLSMLSTIVHEQPGRRVYFFSGMRSIAEHPFQHQLRAIAAEHPNVKLHVSHSKPLSEEVPGRDYDHFGRLNLDILRDVLPSNNFKFFICGSASMMADLVLAMIDWGVPVQDINFESFGPSTVRMMQQAVAARSTPEHAQSLTVGFARSGLESPINAGETLLSAAERNGIELEAGCRTGNCGTCVVKLLAGRVAYSHKPGATVAAGECLPCVATPAGNVVLDI